jgi:hypothetical protein
MRNPEPTRFSVPIERQALSRPLAPGTVVGEGVDRGNACVPSAGHVGRQP